MKIPHFFSSKRIPKKAPWGASSSAKVGGISSITTAKDLTRNPAAGFFGSSCGNLVESAVHRKFCSGIVNLISHMELVLLDLSWFLAGFCFHCLLSLPSLLLLLWLSVAWWLPNTLDPSNPHCKKTCGCQPRQPSACGRKLRKKHIHPSADITPTISIISYINHQQICEKLIVTCCYISVKSQWFRLVKSPWFLDRLIPIDTGELGATLSPLPICNFPLYQLNKKNHPVGFTSCFTIAC